MNNPISQPYFQCERLDVYRIAVKFHRSLIPLRQVRGAADLRDQLLRACESIVLNIAEGAGRFGSEDKRRFYRMANGSAMKAAIPKGNSTRFPHIQFSGMKAHRQAPVQDHEAEGEFEVFAPLSQRTCVPLHNSALI